MSFKSSCNKSRVGRYACLPVFKAWPFSRGGSMMVRGQVRAFVRAMAAASFGLQLELNDIFVEDGHTWKCTVNTMASQLERPERQGLDAE